MPYSIPATAALPKFTKLGLADIGTDTPGTAALQHTSFDPGCIQEQLDTTAGKNMGTLTHSISGNVNNLRRCVPRGSFLPTVTEWLSLLQWITYGTPTGTTTKTYTLDNTAVGRGVLFQDTQFLWSMTGVVVNRATFSAQQAGMLGLDLDLIGIDWTRNTSAFPSLTPSYGPPFLMTQLTVSVGATSGVKCRSFRMTVDNRVNGERFWNSNVQAGGVNEDRVITVSLEMPYGLQKALIDAGASAGGVQVQATFTAGSQVMVVTLPTVRAPEKSIDARVPDEMYMPWEGQAFSDTPNGELSIALTY